MIFSETAFQKHFENKIVNLSLFFIMAVIFFISETKWENLGPGLDLGLGGRGAGGPEVGAMTGAGRSHR